MPDESRKVIYHYVFGMDNWLFRWFWSKALGEGYSADEVEDLWREVIIKVLKHNPAFLSGNYFEIIFHRTFIDARRLSSKLLEEVSLAEERLSMGSVIVRLEDLLAASENLSALEEHTFFRKAYEVLSATRSDARETYWKVFVWTYVHHYSVADIADQLKCTRGAAHGLLRAVHNKLRPWLLSQYPGLAGDPGEVSHEE